MSLTLWVFVVFLFLNGCCISIGVTCYRHYAQKKPSFLQLSILLLQLGLLLLFFIDSLAPVNGPLLHVVWWSIVGSGLFVGLVQLKHQAIVATFNLLLSLFSGLLMGFILLITSM